jgi:hypothetical protein
MGHPGLYRIAYVHDQCLHVSGWRSSNPEQAKAKLGPGWKWHIDQGHFILENLALAWLAHKTDEKAPTENWKVFFEERRQGVTQPARSLRAVVCTFFESAYYIFYSRWCCWDSLQVAGVNLLGSFDLCVSFCQTQ